MINATIQIQNGTLIQDVVAIDSVIWETERRKTPGKLTFSVLKDKDLNFTEGNAVKLTVNGKGVFFGFVVKKERSDQDVIKVTALDQLFYLKYKDTISYTAQSASQLIRNIARDQNLNLGRIAETGVGISSVEDNKEYFEMIGYALDETTYLTGNIFVLYDDFGKLNLSNIEELRSNILIDRETSQSFTYSTSIEGNTYNKIKLVYDNKDTGTREVYIAQDGNSQNNFGTLQYFETLQKGENASFKASQLLKFYNKRSRSLSIKGAIGNTSIRGGSIIAVKLNVGDLDLANYMVVENVKHTFKDNEHFMDIRVSGGEFNG